MNSFGDSHDAAYLKKTGSILIYVLWISALLGLFTLSIGHTVRQKLKMIERIDSRRSLRLAVESGVQRGLWAIHRPSTIPDKKADALSSSWSHNDKIFKDVAIRQTRVSVIKDEPQKAGLGLSYGLIDEESKVNINLLRDSGTLKTLVQSTAGIRDEDASIIADSILDWIDSDDHLNASGAENRFYQSIKRPLVPKNGPLDVLEELLYVRGMTPEIYQHLSRFLTLYGDGKVNLNTATAPVLRALGLESAVVDALLAYRLGVDGKIATRDDGILYDPSELITVIQSYGTVNQDSLNDLEDRLSRGLFKVTSDYYEVQSRATRSKGHETLTARAIISREDGIQSWHERYTRTA